MSEVQNRREKAADLARRLAGWASFTLEEVTEALSLAPSATPEDLNAMVALLLEDPFAKSDPSTLAQLETIRDTLEADRGVAGGQEPAEGVVFDLSDLIAHLRHHRTFTGIQRVQAEVARHAFGARGATVRAAAMITGRDVLVEIPPDALNRLLAAASAPGASGGELWRIELARVAVSLLVDEPLRFRRGDVLINVGSSWWQPDYLRFVHEAQVRDGIAYLPLVHDLVPWLHPEFCGSTTIREFRTWLSGALEIADGFICISASTANDLTRVAASIGLPVDPAAVRTVAIGGTSVLPAADSPEVLERLGLSGESFVLLVSTIEPRKNHVLAFAAWGELVRTRRRDAVPILVCVGREGWRSAPIFDALHRDPDARSRVLLLDRVDDADLGVLYESCAFTLFPSLYEGWGLPVSESLNHGKTPVVSSASSLPEVAGSLGVYFDPGSVSALVAAVTLMLDPVERAVRDARVRARHRPRSWGEVAQAMLAAARSVRSRAPHGRPPNLEPGVWHDITAPGGSPRPRSALRDHRVGEGWLNPDARGSSTRPEGGLLRLPVEGRQPQRLFLRIAGLRTAPCQFAVYVDGEKLFTGAVSDGRHRWVLLDVDLSPGQEALEVVLRGYDSEALTMADGVDRERRACVSLAGYMLCPRDAEVLRADFLESAAYGDLGAEAVVRRAVVS